MSNLSISQAEYVRSTSPEVQKAVESELRKFFEEEGLYGADLEEAVENGIGSRISDLHIEFEAVINRVANSEIREIFKEKGFKPIFHGVQNLTSIWELSISGNYNEVDEFDRYDNGKYFVAVDMVEYIDYGELEITVEWINVIDSRDTYGEVTVEYEEGTLNLDRKRIEIDIDSTKTLKTYKRMSSAVKYVEKYAMDSRYANVASFYCLD